MLKRVLGTLVDPPPPPTHTHHYHHHNHNHTNTRYFVRRRIDTMRSNAAFAAGGVALTIWHGPTRSANRRRDRWATTAVVPSTAGYVRAGTIGAVLVTGGVHRQRLVDCYITAWGDHMIGLEHECMVGRPGNTTALRTLGFALDDAGAAAANGVGTVTLFRCFDNATKNHAVSIEPDCRGRGATEFALGHILAYTPPSLPSNASVTSVNTSKARLGQMSGAAASTSKVDPSILFAVWLH
jgi:hypothetical protein